MLRKKSKIIIKNIVFHIDSLNPAGLYRRSAGHGQVRNSSILPPFTSLIVVLLAALLLLAACAKDEQVPSKTADAELATELKVVRVAPVKSAEAVRSFRFSGVTQAGEQARLAFLVSGEVIDLPVKLGDQVVAGDVIATLRNPQLAPAAKAAEAQLAELRTRLAQAKRDRSRVAELRKNGAATKEEYEQVDAQYRALQSSVNTARAGVAQASELLGETALKAPFSGSVSQVLIDAGDFVSAGQPVAVLSGLDLLEIKLGLPETLLNGLRVNDPVKVFLPFQHDSQVTGVITEVASAAPASGQLFPVVVGVEKMATPAATLRPGLTAEVEIAQQGTTELMVPIRAVVDPGTGQPIVYRFNSSSATVSVVPVVVGDIVGEFVVINGDLTANDQVVHVGLSGLLDGQTVTVAE